MHPFVYACVPPDIVNTASWKVWILAEFTALMHCRMEMKASDLGVKRSKFRLTKYVGNSNLHVEAYRPIESHKGTRETILAGPYHNSVCAENKASRGRKHGEGCPLTIRLGVGGSIVSSSSGVRGRAPVENEFYAYLRSVRSHLEHPFQYFWAMAGPLKCRRARENFPPSPPSRRAWRHTILDVSCCVRVSSSLVVSLIVCCV